MELQTILDAVRTAPSILEGIRRAEDLAVAAERKSGARDVRILAAAASDPADQLTAIAAVHALAQIRDGSADPVLLSFLSHDSHFLREHAAWALGARPPQPGGIPLLMGMVAGGGFVGMLAQRTLEEWSGNAPDQLALALEEALTGVADPGARARLVETAGRGPGRLPEKLLRRVAGDADESVATRVAAIEGLSDRRPNQTTTSMLTAIGRRTDVLADVARLALFDLRPASRPAVGQAGSGDCAALPARRHRPPPLTGRRWATTVASPPCSYVSETPWSGKASRPGTGASRTGGPSSSAS